MRLEIIKLAGGLGSVFQQEYELYQELPSGERKHLLTLAPGVDVRYIDSHLRFVLLHERLSPLPPPLPSVPESVDVGSRLVYVALDTQERRTLIPHFYWYVLELAMHPDGRTLAVKTQLESEASDQENLYLLDVETAELQPLQRLNGRRTRLFSWSPDGKTLGLLMTSSGSGQQELAVIDRETKALRLLKSFDTGIGVFSWLGQSGRILLSLTEGKYDASLTLGLYGFDGSEETYALTLPVASRLESASASPDGSQVLALLRPEDGRPPRQVLLWPAEHRLSWLPEGVEPLGWAAEGATLLCGGERGARPSPCGLAL